MFERKERRGEDALHKEELGANALDVMRLREMIEKEFPKGTDRVEAGRKLLMGNSRLLTVVIAILSKVEDIKAKGELAKEDTGIINSFKKIDPSMTGERIRENIDNTASLTQITNVALIIDKYTSGEFIVE